MIKSIETHLEKDYGYGLVYSDYFVNKIAPGTQYIFLFSE